MTVHAKRTSAYTPDTVLTIRELAEALRCSVRTIEQSDLPTVYLGKRARRYIYGQVLEALKQRSAA